MLAEAPVPRWHMAWRHSLWSHVATFLSKRSCSQGFGRFHLRFFIFRSISGSHSSSRDAFVWGGSVASFPLFLDDVLLEANFLH